MKKTNILYWTFTGLFAAFMFVFALPDIASAKVAIGGFTKMGMPVYLLPFLGVAKTLGVIAILIPGYPRIKEWAYAGLFFDLIGATYCVFSISSPGEMVGNLGFMAVPIALGILAYIYYRKKTARSDKVNEAVNYGLAAGGKEPDKMKSVTFMQ